MTGEGGVACAGVASKSRSRPFIIWGWLMMRVWPPFGMIWVGLVRLIGKISSQLPWIWTRGWGVRAFSHFSTALMAQDMNLSSPDQMTSRMIFQLSRDRAVRRYLTDVRNFIW